VNNAIFRAVTSYSSVEVHQRFGEAHWLHLQGLSSKTSVNLNRMIRSHIPEDSTLYSHLLESSVPPRYFIVRYIINSKVDAGRGFGSLRLM
jgi:hypothetical protein